MNSKIGSSFSPKMCLTLAKLVRVFDLFKDLSFLNSLLANYHLNWKLKSSGMHNLHRRSMWNEIDPIRRQGVNLSTVTSSIILCIHTFQETD